MLSDPGFAKIAPFAADFLDGHGRASRTSGRSRPTPQLLLAMQKRVHDYVVADKGTAKEALDMLIEDWTEDLQGRRQDLIADAILDVPSRSPALRAGSGSPPTAASHAAGHRSQ